MQNDEGNPNCKTRRIRPMKNTDRSASSRVCPRPLTFGFRHSSAIRHSSLVILFAALTLSVACSAEPLRALLITGGCCHDYEAQKKILSKGISRSEERRV